MEEKEIREVFKEFLEWVKARPGKFYNEEYRETKDGYVIKLTTDYAVATVAIHFLNFTIMEYRIDMNDSQDAAFYLHFEFRDLQHAQELFGEMLESLAELKNKTKKKILLCCSCGLTTSFFMMKLNEVSELMELDWEFSAMSVNDIYANADDKDAILVAPQIGYERDKIATVLSDKIVIRVPAQVFASYDAMQMLKMLQQEFDAKVEEEKKRYEFNPHDEHNGTDLIISIFTFANRTQISYRVYEGEEILADKQIIKRHYSFYDVEDIISSLLSIYEEVDTIRIVSPGEIVDGHLTYTPTNINDLDVVGIIKEKYNRKAILINATNAMVLGYSILEDYHEDCVFYYDQSQAVWGTFGVMANGAVLEGKNNITGQNMDQMMRIMTFDENPYTMTRTPEGHTKLVGRYMTGLINFVGPQRIVVYASMVYDVNELKKEISHFVDDNYMPEIIKIDSVRRYLFTGALNYKQ